MHQLIDKFIIMAVKGRYITLIAALLILVGGIAAWKVLPIEAYPELSNPQVRVITLVPGKGSEEVERLVTIPLEKEMYGVPGQTALRSLSLYGLSVIISTYTDGTSTTVARQQVLERIQQANIPSDVEPVLEPDVGSLREIFRYSLSSPYISAMGLRAIQQWDLEKLFRQIPGVIGIVSEGGPTKTYQVNVDPLKLRARGTTLKQVFEAVEHCNATTGGGFIEHNGNALIVRQIGLIKNQEDLRDVTISSTAAGIPIKVRDVADVEIGPMVRRGQVGQDKEDDCVEGIVLLRRGENPSRVLQSIKERLPDIIAALPPGVKLQTLYDREWLINQTLTTVGTNITIGITLVVVLLAIFLVDLRSAVITACVIPLSMLVAFIALLLLGVPANLLSLGAIDFGILVDSAVVMTENIIRRLSEEGQDKTPAQRLLILTDSAREVAGPIVFGIVVIVATFLPIFTFSGVEGKLFRPLAATMVSALLGAGLLALALVPVLASFFLVKKPLIERQSPLVTAARAIYAPTLSWCLKHPLPVILSSIVAVAIAANMFLHTGSEFLPHLEEGNIWLRATIKPGSVTLSQAVNNARQIRETLLRYPEVKQVLSQVGGPDDGTDPARFADQEFYVDLKAAKDWRPEFKENKELLIASMRKDLEQIPGVGYYFTQYIQTTLDEALSGVQGSLVAKISGPDLSELEKQAQHVGKIMAETPGIVDVIVDPLLGQPQFVIEIDRAEAARYGLNELDLKELTEIAIGGTPATTVIEGEKRFEVIVRLAPKFRSTEDALNHVLVDTPSGATVSLAQLATLTEVNGASQIWRDAGSRMGTIRANVRGRDLATAVEDAQKRVLSEVKLPTGYKVQWTGEFQRQREAAHQLTVILPITLAIIITILYIACGTLGGAVIMFSVVPLAAIGAVAALNLTGTYFSISAGVGLIALFGLAVKNGILLVSFVNELRHDGMSVKDAVYTGSITRMRPVLMTATIAAVGLLPAALSNEIGSQTQKPFAIVIIGGLISCTLLTLYVLPALYLRFSPSPGRPKTVRDILVDHSTPEPE
ncbi:MAG: heavy metal efflux system protein [Cyanobacteriota bacterium erpe_2018_sw_21hr_WHONDRS-SW48-000092_B_bin.40]|jgi:cobalt-zinc-cadmium resistance protein CzcA|nr:heavy metal efflux system protein [Cyanobacteriota bacterium erpe_2018_sw_21hr_WHONDRS-SW48-000092_B_bin.40]